MLCLMAKHESDGLIVLGGEGIPYSVIRSKRRKRTISFKFERGGLRVLAPAAAPLPAIEKALQNRAAWILRGHALCKSANEEIKFSNGATFSYLGHPCALRITQGQGAASSCLLSPRALRVHISEENLSPENLRREVRLEILLWLKKRARTTFQKRLDFWAKKLGVRYKKLVVANPSQRWGSCSADNVIRLNWRLMTLPLPILDYVAAHELCHARHKDHSPRFWAFLARAMPDCQARRKKLRCAERHISMLE